MDEEHLERRLTTIFAADVVGYSRLMEANEEGTLRALTQHRRKFFDPTITRYDVRIFKVMGDGSLVEFRSVLNELFERAPRSGRPTTRRRVRSRALRIARPK